MLEQKGCGWITTRNGIDTKPITITIAAASYFVAGLLTILTIRFISMGDPELSFVGGAVLGSQVGAIMHHRQPGAEPTATAKTVLGIMLAICAVIFGGILHLTINLFKYVEVSVPLAAVGSFVFPFVLFNKMWNSLPKK